MTAKERKDARHPKKSQQTQAAYPNRPICQVQQMYLNVTWQGTVAAPPLSAADIQWRHGTEQLDFTFRTQGFNRRFIYHRVE